MHSTQHILTLRLTDSWGNCRLNTLPSWRAGQSAGSSQLPCLVFAEATACTGALFLAWGVLVGVEAGTCCFEAGVEAVDIDVVLLLLLLLLAAFSLFASEGRP